MDPYKIAQVIRNLLSNALKFTNPDRVRTAALVHKKTADLLHADIESSGSPKKRSALRSSVVNGESNFSVITVHDSGAGISMVSE